jgi:hypothetical protein
MNDGVGVYVCTRQGDVLHVKSSSARRLIYRQTAIKDGPLFYLNRSAIRPRHQIYCLFIITFICVFYMSLFVDNNSHARVKNFCAAINLKNTITTREHILIIHKTLHSHIHYFHQSTPSSQELILAHSSSSIQPVFRIATTTNNNGIVINWSCSRVFVSTVLSNE